MSSYSLEESLLAVATFVPASLDSPDAWCGHLPFAAWLVEKVRPKVFVELGTHSGNSYFAFCQAVKERDVVTTCYAVDTWQGDEHAGEYGDEVYEKVHAHNARNYPGFSRLLRMTFDDACGYFSDGAIDLLHIDGLHTYEAVKHDFETWLPRLAPGALVLFHDTNVRERGFGVWRLWEELKARYGRHLEFRHSNGLGVLQLDGGPPAGEWLTPGSPVQQRLRNFFSVLGQCHVERVNLLEQRAAVHRLSLALADKERHASALTDVVAARDEHIANLNAHVRNLDAAAATREQHVAGLNAHVANLETAAQATEQHVASLNAHIANLEAAAKATEQHVANLNAHIANLEAAARTSEQHIANLNAHIANVEASDAGRAAELQAVHAQVEHLTKQLAEREQQVAHANEDLARLQAEVERLSDVRSSKVAEWEQTLGGHARELAQLTAGLVAMERQAEAREQQLQATAAALSEREARIAQLQAEAATHGEHLHGLNASFSELHQRAANLEREIDLLRHSRSWRMTGPLRWAGGQARRIRHLVPRRSRAPATVPLVAAPVQAATSPASFLAPADPHRFRCSVVMPTKDGGAIFQEALAALQRQTIWADTELIVVDSGSSDGTVQAARAAGARVIEIPPHEFNHGATRDFGIALASAEIVILLVQDAVPQDEGLLDAMVRDFDDPEVAGVYARQIPRPDADLLTKRNLTGWLTGRAQREVRKIASIEWYQTLSPMEKYLFCNFDNVCSALRKSVWAEHRFGRINFGEDIDWAERVLKAGWRIVYEPSAAVVHSHDRPMTYEYKRTYVCHRKLYQQFGLRLVPSLGRIHRSWAYSTVQDARYIAAQPAPLWEKVRLMAKVPLLNLFSAVAQYRAARDEAAGRQRQMAGV